MQTNNGNWIRKQQRWYFTGWISRHVPAEQLPHYYCISEHIHSLELCFLLPSSCTCAHGSNKWLGVTVDSSVALLAFRFWRIRGFGPRFSPKIAHTRSKLHQRLDLFPFSGGAVQIHTAHSGDTNKCVCTFEIIFLSSFSLFSFLIRADYIHKSCFHFSGGKKMLFSRPISWSYCVAT